MGQRWVRIDRGDNKDAMNYSRALRDGWRVRSLDTVPDSYHPPIKVNGTFAGALVVDDVVLCERPIERDKQAEARRERRVAWQTDAVNNNVLREIPEHLVRQNVRETKVSRGGRSIHPTPQVQD